MLSRKSRHRLMKIASLFSVVRGYNIPVIILAQYLSAIFILAPQEIPTLDIILDPGLLVLVLASSLAIASGYIINNFYDSEKDLINRPRKSMLDRLVSQKTKLYVYFSLNFIVVILSLLNSWRVALFYSAYIFLIWFYSHKLKKYPIIGNITAAALAVFPFFGILLYYAKMDEHRFEMNQLEIVFLHAAFVFLLLLIREMIKDLENLTGDFASNYHTVPVVYGERASKKAITALVALSVLPVYFLVEVYNIGYMDVYFYFCFIVFIFFLMMLWRSTAKAQYVMLHNILKFLIVAGIFCIVLIKPSVLVHGREMLLN